MVQGRLRKQKLEVEIATSCAHCGLSLNLVVDAQMRWRCQNRGADPHLFLPHIDWKTFQAPSILNDY